ncbi:diguanylate cyclase [Pseudomonas hunanensis]|uniref:Diguanylate cyclase n=2 Tax=Pseudomonas hunanensis TaxID=1247546 RepID=A0ABD6NG52_9PSED|nr:diguanylate cyclase [Pseudomonas hunanensis]PJX12092.1 diguanylate cyclase [Pseudomonas putida]PKF26765.1 diguanylate cyclase [Pseudomonas hunanensis]PTV59287.1 diguanylate cyclase [Pseudomonas putida]
MGPLWERAALVAITGKGGAMHRVACFAGKPAPTDRPGYLKPC